jgi:hypothetical protein
MKFTLAILYAPEGRRPLSIARVNDRALLALVAKQAILEAEATADELMESDPALGTLQLEEAIKLRRVLTLLLATPSMPTGAAVM